MRHLVTIIILLALSATAFALTSGDPRRPTLDIVGKSTEDLRRAGPEGLAALLAQHDRNPGSVPAADIDAVAGQRDARWSRLYWYTDLEAAKSAAAAEHKPILYLRMLGKLTDEYSCANSRFFRTVLYANTNVSNILRDQFVLVWASERPVPVVTIDYGDGRVLKRTITGNSIHYILSPRGEVIDALPGLYDPETFATLLTSAAHAAADKSPDATRQYRLRSLAALDTEWSAVNAPFPGYGLPTIAESPNAQSASARAVTKDEVEFPVVRAVAPNAAVAAERAFSKLRVERPLVKAAGMSNPPNAKEAALATTGKRMAEAPLIKVFVPPAPAFVPNDADADLWITLAQRRAVTARLDQNSINLIRSQNPRAYINPTALDHVVNNFQNAIAIDTLRNNHLFRRQILSWLLTAPTTLDALNTRVYSELFLTPRSDPWLGLVPESTYSALTSDGCSIH